MGASLVLGSVGPMVTTAAAFSATMERNFTDLYLHAPDVSSPLFTYIQTKQYLVQTQTAVREYASSISLVVRTANVWVDRTIVRVAYQVKDTHGSVIVAMVRKVTMVVQLGSSQLSTTCNTEYTEQSEQSYVAYCSLGSVPGSWFDSSLPQGTASVILSLRNAQDSDTISQAAGSLAVRQPPRWYRSSLRAPTTEFRYIPGGHSLTSGGLFITTPVSPVQPSEQFDVYMYAHTAGYALNSMTVVMYYSSDLLEYVSFGQTSHFNGAVFDSSEAGRLAWVITGRSALASASDVTGEAIYLVRVTLRFKSGAAAGTHEGATLGLYPFAQTLVNNGNLPFVQAQAGQVWTTGADGPQSYATIEVHRPVDMGIFAYSADPVLFNTALLDGVTRSHSMTVVKVTSDALSNTATSTVTPSGCSTQFPADASPYYSLDATSCAVSMSSAHTGAGLTDVALQVSVASFVTSVSFKVYTPTLVAVAAEDPVLNRFADIYGAAISTSCASGSCAYPYQRTRVSAVVDSLDASTLVQFAVTNSTVASLGSGALWNMLQGTAPGSTLLHLNGLPGGPSVTISVSDELVYVVDLRSRVVTSAAWSLPPDSVYASGSLFTAGVVLQNVMQAEGDSGFMFSTVRFSDGATMDVGYAPVPGIEEMVVTTSNPNVVTISPYSSGEDYWQLAAAVGAVRDTPEDVFVNWTISGQTIYSSTVPLLLTIPGATHATFSIQQPRITDPDDASALSPLNLPTSSSLQVLVYYDDGAVRDLTTDLRIVYSTPFPGLCYRQPGTADRLCSCRGNS